MKRLFSLSAIMLSAAVVMSVAGGSAAAVENVSPDGNYTINVPYEYPFKSGTDEWFALETHDVRAAVSQIPENVLHALTTGALVETVVNYPFMSDMLLFSDGETGYQIVRDHFNGLQELEARPDGLEKLIEFYEADKAKAVSTLGVLDQAAVELTILLGNFQSDGGVYPYSIEDEVTFEYIFEIYPSLQSGTEK